MAEQLSAEERILFDAPRNGRLAQSYIIHAASPKSAKSAAYDFARRIMCEEHTGCKRCSSCLKFDGLNHVDAYIITNDSATLKKEDVENIPLFLAEKPYEGGYKIVFIPDADRMNVTAQNLLLKSVEEPPQNVVFIFSTSNISGILRTIRSRSVEILIRPIPKKAVRDALGLKGEMADVYAAYSGGSIEEAKELIKDDSFNPGRNEAMAVIEILYTYRNPNVYKLAARLADDIAARSLYAATIFMDAIKLSFGMDRLSLLNADMYDKIKTLSDRFTAAGMSRMTDILLEANEKKKAFPGLNSRLLAEDIIIKLLEVRSRCLKL
ncbi:MAG: hypothetical protein IJD14_06090 [Christensenellaceae bacterium]|nr:hypothetical protein [Christensenellaceae bacterium]